ncbi:alpha/beta fold hydrolase [Amycolatopsis pithecellobii]|uniref:Alpha/beta fold hydrolase n=1 Tax=Amycolatopsis pithecellobii TaxID=664692 RepID=A0A6N7YZF8_9PSEU|nr:alpha/beta hydrolase [Amycolatopsis pithecellobii]MTD52600.1 alpha/beta fold hydrolase [Amycolatopsis pithecellobii]
MNARFVTVDDGVDLFCTDSGDTAGARPVVLVHGWLCDSDDWVHLIPLLTAHTRVITVDLRGHGRSTVASSGYGPAVFADDVATVMRALGVSNAVVAGHSAGGEVGLLVGERHPDLVAGLVAIDPVYALPAERRAGFETRAEELSEPGAAALASAHFASIEGPNTPDYLREWHRRRPFAIAPHVIAETSRGFALGPDSIRLRPDADAVLLRRRVPVFAVYRDAAQAAVDRALCPHPASEIHSWPDAGHWLHQEDPVRFHRMLRSWLARLDR